VKCIHVRWSNMAIHHKLMCNQWLDHHSWVLASKHMMPLHWLHILWWSIRPSGIITKCEFNKFFCNCFGQSTSLWSKVERHLNFPNRKVETIKLGWTINRFIGHVCVKKCDSQYKDHSMVVKPNIKSISSGTNWNHLEGTVGDVLIKWEIKN